MAVAHDDLRSRANNLRQLARLRFDVGKIILPPQGVVGEQNHQAASTAIETARRTISAPWLCVGQLGIDRALMSAPPG